MEEKWTEAVKKEDVVIVGNVLGLIKKLECCTDYTLTPVAKGYELLAWVNIIEQREFTEIPFSDLELIEQVDVHHVKVMGVRSYKDSGKCCVRVRIISMTERCLITDTALYRVRKRTRWWEFS